MTDRLFRSMVRDRDSRKDIGPLRLLGDQGYYDSRSGKAIICDRCGTLYYAGDWPFCGGTPESHRRD